MRIETPRLVLREFTKEDLDAFALLIGDSEVMRFSTSGPIEDKEQVKKLFQNRILDHYALYGYGMYAAVQKLDHSLIGFIGLITQHIDNEEKVELGYRLHPKYWGQGLATEGCLAVCHYAFDQLKIESLIAIIDPKNTPSIKVAKRLGMHYWKEALFHYIAVHIYALQNVDLL